jgi:hypothetical protein
VINKINTFTLAALALISANTQAICTMEDLYGNWQIKYRSIKPQAVGVCNLEISGSKGLTGGCTNLTYGYSATIFDSSYFIRPNCTFVLNAVFTDGSSVRTTAKLQPTKNNATGNVVLIDQGRRFSGKFSIARQ